MIQPSTIQQRTKQAVRAAAIGIVVALIALSATAQSAKDIKGATPLVAIQNEAPAKLIVDPPIPRTAGPGSSIHSVPDGKLTHCTGIRQSCIGSVAARWPPALLRGRPILADSRHQRRNGRSRGIAARTTQSAPRIGGHTPQADS